MADVITRFKLETTQYDSKLRDAAKSLSDYARQATVAGNEFGKFTEKNVEAAKAFGNIATSATNSKDKVKELVSAFNTLAKTYNDLTQEQQQSDFGKAMAGSLNTLKDRITEAKQELYSMGDSGKSTGGIMGVLKDKLTVNIDALKLFNVGLTAAKAALDVAKDAFFNNEQNLDEWGRTVASSESLYKGFLNAINTGDISGFLDNINNIVKAARDAYNALDELATFNAFNQVNVEKTRTKMTESIVDFREGNATKETVKASGDSYKKELQERQRLEKEAYLGAIKDIAQQRGVNYNDLRDAMSGSWGHYQDLKKVQPTGMRVVSFGNSMFGGGGSYIEKFAQNREEKLGEALRHLNDTELKSLQALGAQAERTGNEIAQVDKQIQRVLKGSSGGESGNKPTKKNAVKGGTNDVFDPTSIAAQETLVQELTKLWRTCGETVRDEYKARLDEAKAVLQEMQNPTKQLEMAEVADLSGKGPKVNLTQGAEFNPLEKISNIRGMVFEDLNAELERLKDLLSETFDPTEIEAYGKAMEEIVERQKKLKGEEKDKKDTKGKDVYREFNDKAEKLVGGMSSISTGLKGLGVEVPKQVDDLINILSTVMQIIQGVQAIISIGQIGAISANTAAVTANTYALIAKSFFGFEHGGVVHAANGWAGVVPGSQFSGDNIPIMANAGEVVLTRAMAGNLASQLDGGMNGLQLSATVRAEQIDFVMNNRGRRTGHGEYVQSNKRR